MQQTQTEPRRNPLGYRPVGKLLRQFALPSVISMLVNALYNIVDQIFIGQGVGYLGNAATTVAFPIVTIVLAMATLLGAGGSSYAAIKLGEKKEEEAEQTLGNMFTLLLGIGLLITVLGLVFLDPILKVFGATPGNMDYARDYSAIILLGVPFNMIGIGLSNLARTDGSPKFSMYSMVAGAVLNTILDPIYIFVFGWGVKGAAIATITSQIISAGMLFWYFCRKSTMRLHLRSMRLRAVVCLKACALGVSSCITQLAATLLQIVMNNSLVFYGEQTSVTGDVALSAMGIVLKVSMILLSVCIGIGIGAQPILGFNRGAEQPERIKKTYLLSIGMATAVSVAGWLLCLLIPDVILKLFGSADANFTDFAVKCMRIYLLGIFSAGFQVVSTNYFQATGQPLKASVLSLMRQVILLVPLILILPLSFGLDGILYAGPIADTASAVVVACFVLHELRRLDRWIGRQKEERKETLPQAAGAQA